MWVCCICPLQVSVPEGRFGRVGTKVLTLLPRLAVINVLPRPVFLCQRGWVLLATLENMGWSSLIHG